MYNAHMTKKMTKTEAKKAAEILRTKAIGWMGTVALGGNEGADAEDLLLQLGELLTKEACGGSWTFVSLLECYGETGYFPTLRGDINPNYAILADLYDFFQARHGVAARAFRG